MGHIKLKSFCTAKETIRKIKRQPTEWENIFTYTSDNGWYPKFIKNLQNSIPRNQMTQLKNWQRTLVDTPLKKTYRCPITIWKRCSVYLYSENCKTLKKDTEGDTNKLWKHTMCSWRGRINIIKMSMLPKAI